MLGRGAWEEEAGVVEKYIRGLHSLNGAFVPLFLIILLLSRSFFLKEESADGRG